MLYPSNIPDYNVFRVSTLDSVDTEDILPLVFVAPRKLIPFIIGQASILCEVNAWNERGALTSEDMVDLFCNEVIMSTDICSLVAACIRDNEAVRDEIREIIDGAGAGRAPGSFEDQTAANDLDCVYGGCVALIDYLFSELERILDILDTSADIAEGVADFLPTSSSLVISRVVFEAFGFIAGIGTAIVRSSLSIANRDRLACDLFCLIVSQGGVGYVVTNETLLSWVQNLDDGTYPDAVIQYLLNGIVIVITEDPIPLIDPTTLINYYILGTNDCSADWLSLCTCSTWSHTYDYTVSQCDVTPRTNQAVVNMVWEAGKGWKSGRYANALENAVFADITTPTWGTSAIVTGFEVELEIDRDGAATGNAFNSPFAAPKTAINTTVDDIGRTEWELLDGIVTIEHDISPTSVQRSGYRVLASSRNFNTGTAGGSVYIRKLTIFGTGNPPDI